MAFFGLFKNGALVHLSDQETEVVSKFETLGADKLQRIESLGRLSEILNENQEKPKTAPLLSDEDIEAFAESMSDAAETVMQKLEKLEDAGVENIQKLRDSGKSIVAEVKSLGIRGVSALNEQLKSFSSQLDETLSAQQSDDKSNEGEI